MCNRLKTDMLWLWRETSPSKVDWKIHVSFQRAEGKVKEVNFAQTYIKKNQESMAELACKLQMKQIEEALNYNEHWISH